MPFAPTAPVIHWCRMKSPLGALSIAVSPRGLCAVEFGRITHHFFSGLHGKLIEDREATAVARNQLIEYFLGRRKTFDLKIDLASLTRFQREVLAVTNRIPWGEVWSYHRLAVEMGRAKSSRPVGQALGRNPIPIVIPCHRVIASDGSLGGYCGTAGLDLKRWLLRHEGVRL